MSFAVIWSALGSRLAGPVAAAAALALACVLAASLAGAQVLKVRLARASADRDAWKAAAARWETSARGLKQSFADSEAARSREAARARASLEGERSACSRRVETARRSARAIETIVTKEIDRDSNGCPARGLVPGEQLRNALAPGG